MTHHRLSTCHRHPTPKPITGFCASCLRERLSTIDSSSSSAAATPRLRRTKSTSANPNAASSSASAAAAEPRRKSCDVVGPRISSNNNNNDTLSNLFTLDDHLKAEKISASTNLGLEVVKVEEKVQQEDDDGEFKTMKEFIDLELEKKKTTTSAGFWETASFFSKKLLKWKQKQQQQQQRKSNKKENCNSIEDHNKPNSRPIRDTLSEIGVYGYLGRRSCDTDPRLSVDNGRYSFEEPRASWDGYLIGRAYPKLVAPMAIVEEKVNLGNEEDKSKNENESESESESPGGSAQTRDYYGDSLSLTTQRRRRSFDRSNSGKRVTSLVDVDEVKAISHAKVSPETVGLFHGAKLLVTEKELRDSNWYSIKDYREESVDSDSKKNAAAGGGEADQKGLKFRKSKSLRWRKVLSMWGFMHKRSESSKCCGDGKEGEEEEEEEERRVGGNVNVVDGPLSESWQKLKRVANGEANGTVSEKLIRSYSVSANKNNACKVDGLCSGMNGVGLMESKDNGVGGRRRDELMLQRNRTTTAYSPNNLDNGLLRFYLTPVRSYRRSKSGRSRLKNSQSMALSGL